MGFPMRVSFPPFIIHVVLPLMLPHLSYFLCGAFKLFLAWIELLSSHLSFFFFRFLFIFTFVRLTFRNWHVLQSLSIWLNF